MRHGSLFSGIGGFDLASEWMGWENVFHCEWNEFGQKVLKYYWPKAITYNDITKTDFSIHRGSIDIITGGFPCQPYSMAGKRLGKEDERHLWPEMRRAIREVRPTWVVGENVLGLVNWNGGMVFEEVQTDLEAEGYEVQAFVLPAASVNAPHKRERVWFVAFNAKSSRNSKVGKVCEGKNNESIGICNSNIERSFINTDHKGRGARPGQVQGKDGEVSEWDNNAETSDSNIQSDYTNSKSWGKGGLSIESQKTRTREGNESSGGLCGLSLSNASNSNNSGLQAFSIQKSELAKENRSTSSSGNGSRFIRGGLRWEAFPISAPICDGNDGISNRLDSITFSKWRNESIKAGGNAIVPQVVYQIFKAIEQYNNLNK